MRKNVYVELKLLKLKICLSRFPDSILSRKCAYEWGNFIPPFRPANYPSVLSRKQLVPYKVINFQRVSRTRNSILRHFQLPFAFRIILFIRQPGIDIPVIIIHCSASVKLSGKVFLRRELKTIRKKSILIA